MVSNLPSASASPIAVVRGITLSRLRAWGLSAVLLGGLCFVGVRAVARGQSTFAAPALLSGIAFRDQHGVGVQVERFAGTSILLNFVFTRCPSICPTQTRELVQLREALPTELRERVSFVSISLDPEYDSPEKLLTFSRKIGADWAFLAASPSATRGLSLQLQGAAIAPALLELETKPAALPNGHGTALYLFDRSGRLMQRYVGAPIDQKRLLADLARVDRVSQRSTFDDALASRDR